MRGWSCSGASDGTRVWSVFRHLMYDNLLTCTRKKGRRAAYIIHVKMSAVDVHQLLKYYSLNFFESGFVCWHMLSNAPLVVSYLNPLEPPKSGLPVPAKWPCGSMGFDGGAMKVLLDRVWRFYTCSGEAEFGDPLDVFFYTAKHSNMIIWRFPKSRGYPQIIHL
jgi:hypothetical protein